MKILRTLMGNFVSIAWKCLWSRTTSIVTALEGSYCEPWPQAQALYPASLCKWFIGGKELAHRTSCDVLQSGCSPSHTRMPLLYSEDALPLKRGCLSGSWPGWELSGFFLQRKKKKQFSICLSYKILNSNRTKHTFSWLLGVWKILLFYERIHFTSFILSQQWP